MESLDSQRKANERFALRVLLVLAAIGAFVIFFGKLFERRDVFSALSKAPFSFIKESGLIMANSVFLLVGFLAAYLIGKIFRLHKQMPQDLLINP